MTRLIAGLVALAAACSAAQVAAASPTDIAVPSRGKLVATHFAGPTWQAKDGSSVGGERP
jgi:hypothetical protein